MSETGTDTGNGAAVERRPSASEAALAADLKPTGALERMMIQQMARAHDTTLACFGRAEAAEETPGARAVELRLAARFMALFMQQAGALDRRRAQARQAEQAAQRLSFDERAAETRARMAHWEESLRRFEGAAGAGGRNEPDEQDEPDDLEDLAAFGELDDPEALRDMATRLGLPSPVGADGNIDPAALEVFAARAEDILFGGPGAGPAAANGAGAK